MKKTKPKKKTPGPKPETLKINGAWQDAVKKSLDVKKPQEGWPKYFIWDTAEIVELLSYKRCIISTEKHDEPQSPSLVSIDS